MKFVPFLLSVALVSSFFGFMQFVPEITLAAIESGLVAAPDNYEIYKDL